MKYLPYEHFRLRAMRKWFLPRHSSRPRWGPWSPSSGLGPSRCWRCCCPQSENLYPDFSSSLNLDLKYGRRKGEVWNDLELDENRRSCSGWSWCWFAWLYYFFFKYLLKLFFSNKFVFVFVLDLVREIFDLRVKEVTN